MKPMQEKHDFLAALMSIKDQGICATLAFVMAYLRSRYNGAPLGRAVIEAAMCAMFGWFSKDLLAMAGMNPDLAYVGSVFVGYLGTKYLGRKVSGEDRVNE